MTLVNRTASLGLSFNFFMSEIMWGSSLLNFSKINEPIFLNAFFLEPSKASSFASYDAMSGDEFET